MRNLQVLTGINISNSSASTVPELGELTSLRDLKISLSDKLSKCKTKEEMLLASLCKLSSYKLQSLHIIDNSSDDLLERWFPIPCFLRLFRMSTNHFLPQLPKWIKPSLTKMAYLNINLREIKEEDMETLGDLPALLYLEIWLEPNPKKQLTVQSTGFPCLKEFLLVCSDHDGGAYLTFGKGAMPKLEKLEIPFHGTVRSDTESAVAAIKREASANPNHPRLATFGADAEEVQEDNSEESDYNWGSEDDGATDT
uniref:Disease resistance R13L4/SHOC-2-like LRR domain-containing protein n=1 Tax=Oryza barthii TaxID=65489 RepID=A0A0D3HAV8_9ORYZ